MNIRNTFHSFNLIFNRVFKIASRLEPKYIPVWRPDGSLPDRPFVIIIPVCFLIFFRQGANFHAGLYLRSVYPSTA